MKRSFRSWPHAGIVAFAGVAIAATAAFAYERSDLAPHSTLLAGQMTDPGVDFMITGPAGPGDNPDVRSEASASDDADRPQRRRMHLK